MLCFTMQCFANEPKQPTNQPTNLTNLTNLPSLRMSLADETKRNKTRRESSKQSIADTVRVSVSDTDTDTDTDRR